MIRLAACCDLGGTSLKFGLVDPLGSVVWHDAIPTPVLSGQAGLLQALDTALQNALTRVPRDSEVVGIGIATAGQIDASNGRVLSATDNLPGWAGTSVRDWVIGRFGIPGVVENDVNAMAIGESWIGAAVGQSDVLCLTVGTGIGGGLIADGHLYRGHIGAAGEVGHMVYQSGGRMCTCGNSGCWEQYASANALVAMATRYLTYPVTDDMVSSLGSRETLTAEHVLIAAKEGDLLAQEVVEQWVVPLGDGLASLVHIFNPQMIVVGGGISLAGDALFGPLRCYVLQHVMPVFASGLSLVPAKLGNQAALVGVARMVFEGM